MMIQDLSVRVAYLINQYPSVSHTFIRREIYALERLGLKVVRIAIKGWNLPLVDQADILEREQTHYALRQGSMRLLLAFGRRILARPVSTLGAILLAIKMWKQSDRSLLVHLAYVVEACQIVEWMENQAVVHLHAHFCTNSTEVAMQCRQLGGPPYSFTTHGSDIMDKPTLMGLAEKTTRAKFAVAVCSYGRSQLFRWIPHEIWEKIHVIRCGLDDSFLLCGPTLNRKSKHLVCVGRLSKEKGQLLLIEAVSHIVATGQQISITLVGDGPMLQEIQNLSTRYGLDNYVHVAGWQDTAGVRQAIIQADALVLPSLSEGLPVVIMEAMALGRIVIAPYLAGIPELVSHGSTGWLFPAGDSHALAQAIQELLTAQPKTLELMAEKAFQRVKRLHNINHSANELRKLFLEH